MDKLMQQFGKKWGLEPLTVSSVYYLIQSYDGKYGKSRKALKSFGIELNVRQIRYFYKKVNLHKRIGGERPENYRDLLRQI